MDKKNSENYIFSEHEQNKFTDLDERNKKESRMTSKSAKVFPPLCLV